jgi:UDP-N-acetylmuramate--alanine ligase
MKPGIRLSRLHFVGIGGAGMSALAEVLAGWGFSISGSDARDGEALDRLRSLGMRIEVGHRAENLKDADALVYSSAVPGDNPEMAAARARGIPLVRRAEMLGETMAGKYGLAVSGTHGKTTTTTMLGRIWMEAGKQPTILAGGTTRGDNSAVLAGKGDAIIVEADEFDRSFLAMRPVSAILNNIDSDHLDIYGTLAAVREAFLEFTERLPFYGLAVVNRDDEGVKSLLGRIRRKVVTYGLEAGADYRAVNVKTQAGGMVFTLERRGATQGEITLRVPGTHNVYNALAAATLSLEEGLDFEQVRQGLKGYQGAKRRLESRGEKSGVAFYDDYAHHPTEVAATLQAARGLAQGRVVAVFQPHLYSRTQQLYKEFAMAFLAGDELFVTKVYPSREKPIAGVEGSLIVDEARNLGMGARVHYVEDLTTLAGAVAPLLRAGDLVVTMGAGDIGTYCGPIMEKLA